MFDLDHFKEINDNLGHETGDTVLQEVATKLEQVVSENGFLARYGGDEFIAIIDSSNEKELEKITLAARKVVQKVDCYNKKVTHLDVSYGYSFYHESSSGDKLVDLADMRMYENKKSKRTS
jgi:diguanylate cyclase